jgi:hypothetical protein
MPAPGIVRIVGLVRVRHHAIGERGFDRRGGERGAGDRGGTFPSRSQDIALRRAAGRQPRPGNHRRKGIEDMMLGLLSDFGRKAAASSCAHIFAKRSHLRTHRGGLCQGAHRLNGKANGRCRRQFENAASSHCRLDVEAGIVAGQSDGLEVVGRGLGDVRKGSQAVMPPSVDRVVDVP